MGAFGLGDTMGSKLTFAATTALVLSSFASAQAADLVLKAKPAPAPSFDMFDVAFGGALMSDYNFRGISQSDRGPSGTFYTEGRLNPVKDVQLYAGIQAWATKLPTSPSGEFDIYGGIRPTFGSVTFDFGAMYYYYPNENQVFVVPTAGPVGLGFPTTQPAGLPLIPWTKADTDFWEVYGKASWTVNDQLTLGGYLYYANNWLNTGASGTYFGGTVKVSVPSKMLPKDYGVYISGEVARYALGQTDAFFGNIDLPDYTYWNVGIALTYKALTFDLRYHDTSLSQQECFTITGDLNGLDTGLRPGRSNWCGGAIIAKLSADTTLAALK